MARMKGIRNVILVPITQAGDSNNFPVYDVTKKIEAKLAQDMEVTKVVDTETIEGDDIEIINEQVTRADFTLNFLDLSLEDEHLLTGGRTPVEYTEGTNTVKVYPTSTDDVGAEFGVIGASTYADQDGFDVIKIYRMKVVNVSRPRRTGQASVVSLTGTAYPLEAIAANNNMWNRAVVESLSANFVTDWSEQQIKKEFGID